MPQSQGLRIFLSYSKLDRFPVRQLYERLLADGFLPWFDEESLLPGDDWKLKIARAVRRSNIVLICLSSQGLKRKGYFWKEVRLAIEELEQQPEDTVFVIPIRLDNCDVPEKLKARQYVDAFTEAGYSRLRESLKTRAQYLRLPVPARALTPGKIGKEIFFVKKLELSEMPGGAGKSWAAVALRDLSDPLSGDYEVEGVNEDGKTYHGTATITRRDDSYFVISRIGLDTFICKGVRSGNLLKVTGDFDVAYEINEDGSLQGVWGDGGAESLLPQPLPSAVSEQPKVDISQELRLEGRIPKKDST